MQSTTWQLFFSYFEVNNLQEIFSPSYGSQGDKYIGGFPADWRSRHGRRKGWDDDNEVKDDNNDDFDHNDKASFIGKVCPIFCVCANSIKFWRHSNNMAAATKDDNNYDHDHDEYCIKHHTWHWAKCVPDNAWFCFCAFSTFEDTRQHHDRSHEGRCSQLDSRNCKRENVFVIELKSSGGPKAWLIAFEHPKIEFTSIFGLCDNKFGGGKNIDWFSMGSL